MLNDLAADFEAAILKREMKNPVYIRKIVNADNEFIWAMQQNGNFTDKNTVKFGAVTMVSERFPASVFRVAEKSRITALAKHLHTLTEGYNSQG
jgi:hypothetical protein